MFKRTSVFILVAGTALFFNACTSATQPPPSRATVDSIVNVRVNALQLQMLAKNDSIINAMARKRADSILTTMKMGK